MFCTQLNHRASKSRRPYQLVLLLIVLPLLLQITVLNNVARAFDHDEANESHYDPERETDGMPMVVVASRRVSQPRVNRGDQEAGDNEQSKGIKKSSLQKRSDDRDQEEDMDDDDHDEDKSGSAHHDSYESPAFGESRKAAQDGEDIERFFDTHLGPQEPALAESSGAGLSATLPEKSAGVTNKSASSDAELDSTDDQYVAAASSPLSDILHTLMKAHRRPIVIHATDDSALNTNNGAQQHNPSIVSPAPTGQVVTLVGAGSQPLPIDHSAAAAGLIQAAATAAVAPFTLFAPVQHNSATMHTTPGYEPHQEASSNGIKNGVEDQAAPIREIYIARRPSIIHHFRALAPMMASASSGGHRLVQQSSNTHWRGLNAPSYIRIRQRPVEAAPQQYVETQATDYLRYPIMANSYSHPRKYVPAAREPARQTDDESAVVSYNLSLGGSSAAAATPEDDSNESDGNYRAQMPSIGQQQAHPHAYNQGYASGQGYSPVHYSAQGRHTSSTQAYNNYYHPLPAASYMPRGRGPEPKDYTQEYAQQGTRYYKGSPESGSEPIKYFQVYSNQGLNTAAQTLMRIGQPRIWSHNGQKLLIPVSPYYKQMATPPAQLYAQQSAADLRWVSKSRLGQDNDDAGQVNYSSFQSKLDPHKSSSASSGLATEPKPENSMQKGSLKAPLADRSNSVGESNHTDHSNDNASTPLARASELAADRAVDLNRDSLKTSNLAVTRDRQPQKQSANSMQLATGLLTRDITDLDRMSPLSASIATNNSAKYGLKVHANHRVRREDSDDREAEDADEDGSWVDDDEDDDNRQTASDLSATTRDPEEDEDGNEQQANGSTGSHEMHDIVSGPHSYELANDR